MTQTDIQSPQLLSFNALAGAWIFLLASALLFGCDHPPPQSQHPVAHPRPSSAPLASAKATVVPRRVAKPVDVMNKPIAPLTPPARPAAIERGPLDAFFTGLSRAERRDPGARVAVLHFGDSHTASDTLSGPLRAMFQGRFGDAGRGYAYPGVPWKNFNQKNMAYDMGGRWKTHRGTRNSKAIPYGMGVLGVHTSARGAWLSRATCVQCEHGDVFDSFRIHYLVQPGGGRFEVRIDDRLYQKIRTHDGEPRLGIVGARLPPGDHEIKIVAKGDGDVIIYGIVTELEAPGVIYEALGINGAQATHFLSKTPDIVHAEVASRIPDLIVVAFGTNESFSSRYRVSNPATEREELQKKMRRYEEHFSDLLTRYKRAAPKASCLVLLPPDLAPKTDGGPPCHWVEYEEVGRVCLREPPHNFAGLIEAQRRVAARLGCATWDQQHAMGGPGSFGIWAALKPSLGAPDGVHLTRAGYRALAEMLFADLMLAYDDWKEGRDEVLHTSVVYPALRSNIPLTASP